MASDAFGYSENLAHSWTTYIIPGDGDDLKFFHSHATKSMTNVPEIFTVEDNFQRNSQNIRWMYTVIDMLVTAGTKLYSTSIERRECHKIISIN